MEGLQFPPNEISKQELAQIDAIRRLNEALASQSPTDSLLDTSRLALRGLVLVALLVVARDLKTGPDTKRAQSEISSHITHVKAPEPTVHVVYMDKSVPTATPGTTSTFVSNAITDVPKTSLAILTDEEIAGAISAPYLFPTPEVTSTYQDDSVLDFPKKSSATPTSSPTEILYQLDNRATPKTTLAIPTVIPTRRPNDSTPNNRPTIESTRIPSTPTSTPSPETSSTSQPLVEVTFVGEKSSEMENLILEMCLKNEKLVKYLVKESVIKSSIRVEKNEDGGNTFFVYIADEIDGPKQITGTYMSSFQTSGLPVIDLSEFEFQPYKNQFEEMEFGLQLELGRRIYGQLSDLQKKVYKTQIWDSRYNDGKSRSIINDDGYNFFIFEEADFFAVDLHFFLRGDKKNLTEIQLIWFENNILSLLDNS